MDTRLLEIEDLIRTTWPGVLSIDVAYEDGYYWIVARREDDDGPYTMTGFMSRDELWQWSSQYAAAVVLMRMAMTYSLENNDAGRTD